MFTANAGTKRKYILMSMDTELAEIFLQDGIAVELGKVYNSHLFPVGTTDVKTLFDWYNSRRIPASRQHLDELQANTGMCLDELIEKSYAASLSDSFWLKPQDIESERIGWKDVNFFQNDFTDDIGEFLVRGDGKISSLVTPTNTTDGMYPKKWIIKNGIRYLVKKGGNLIGQSDHLNEIFAYKIGKFLGVNVTPYFVMSGGAFCMCPCFVKPGQNLVTAYAYLASVEKKPKDGGSDANLYPPLAKPFGRKWIDEIILLDFITMNRDRHTKNFGLIQDAFTGKIVKPAPIYDSGNSMFYNIDFGRDLPFENECDNARPFAHTHYEQIKLADLSPYRKKLRELSDKIYGMVLDSYDTPSIPSEYVDSMAQCLTRRVKDIC